MAAQPDGRAKSPLLLGHRGCRRGAPENTCEAFDKALADGCDGFEFDVRHTADARNVICHDASLCGVEIATATFDQLVEHSAGALACLEDIIARYTGRAYLDIELKTPGTEEATVELLRDRDRARVVVSSFLPEVIERVHLLDATIPVGFIFDNRRAMVQWGSLPITHVMPHHSLVTEALVDQWHEAGKRVIAWTVNDRREMERLAAWGVDGLISDDTELLGRMFGRLR